MSSVGERPTHRRRKMLTNGGPTVSPPLPDFLTQNEGSPTPTPYVVLRHPCAASCSAARKKYLTSLVYYFRTASLALPSHPPAVDRPPYLPSLSFAPRCRSC